MKYFDTLPQVVEDALIKRGVNPSKLLYCVKADMDGEGCYYDQYITFTKDTLHIICGYDKFGRIKDAKKKHGVIGFDVKEYSYIPIEEMDHVYIDRLQNTARLMVEYSDKTEKSIARISLGFAEKFEQFTSRLNATKKEEPIDDSLLESQKLFCPICGERFPDPNRPICPNCIDKHSIFKRLMGMFKEFKFTVIAVLACYSFGALIGLFAPYLSTKTLFDDVLAVGGKHYGEILYVVIMLVIVNLVSRILNLISGVLLAYVVPKVTHDLRCKIFSSMQKLSLPFFTNKQTGSLMTRIDNDSENVYWFFVDILPYGLLNISRIIGIAFIMFRINPILSSGIILLILMNQLIQTKFFKGQRKLYRKLHIATRKSNAVLSDALNGQRVVKAFAKEEEENKRYDSRNRERFAIDRTINYRLSDTLPFLWFMYHFLNFAISIVGTIMILNGKIAFGALLAIMNYSDLIYEPINFFTWIGNRWANCVDAASRMFEILDSEPTVKESENPVHKENLIGEIELRNVSFAYEPGHPIIKNVSFRVDAGQMFGIVGKTGAGKSTIINLIARLYDVTEGEILIDHTPIKEIAISDLRKHIGIVSQESYIFAGTVADNIRYAKPDATMEEVIKAAKAANAHEFITKLPDAYQTIIGDGGSSLSGGEKQRISIARAIIQSPSILILDEATASMDTRTERKIQVAIDDLKKGRTIISIAHRLSTLRDADMLCVIENGEVKEMGTHDELIHNKDKYYELYRLQADALKYINMGEA